MELQFFDNLGIWIGDFNWLAIAIATIVAFVWGGLWYGPLFGKAWINALPSSNQEIKPSAAPFIISLITSFGSCLVMAGLIAALNLSSWVDGALLGLICGIGFVAFSNISDGAFCRFSWSLLLIQSGYRATYFAQFGVILTIW